MESIKKELEKIIRNYSYQEHMTDAIDGDDIDKIIYDISCFIQSVFDPENQPNQFGIKNPFESNKNDFEKSVEPAIRYLLQNHNPHTKIFIDYDNAELLFGNRNYNLTNEVPD